MFKIDIIVTTFFDAQNIKKLLERLITEQEFNAIIVVEASNDDRELAIIENCIEVLSCKNVIKSVSAGKQLTAGQARNLGVAHSISEYVAFLDSDDLWESNRLANLHAKIRHHDVIVGQYLAVDAHGKKILRSNKNNHLTLNDHLRGQTFCASSIIVKRSIASDILFWCKRREDFEWMIRILLSGHKVYYDNQNRVIWSFKNKSNHIQRKLPRMIDQYRVYRLYFNVFKSFYFWCNYLLRAIRNWSR